VIEDKFVCPHCGHPVDRRPYLTRVDPVRQGSWESPWASAASRGGDSSWSRYVCSPSWSGSRSASWHRGDHGGPASRGPFGPTRPRARGHEM